MPSSSDRRHFVMAASVLLTVVLGLYFLNNPSTESLGTKNDVGTAHGGQQQGQQVGSSSKLQHRSALFNEYQRLQRDIKVVQQGVDALMKQLHGEPKPPKVDPLTLKTLRPRMIILPNSNRSDVPGQEAPIAATGASGGDTASSQHETIFTSIASFRDEECPNTVRDMYKRAFNPQRLFLGIIEQNDPADVGCIPTEYLEPECAGFPAKYRGFCPTDNIRIRRVLPTAAKGPTFGRWVGMLMYRDEKYFMMIDSHNRFLNNWDAKVIAMHLSTRNKKAVLSHYPNEWLNKSAEQQSAKTLMVMCHANFLPDLGYPRLGARWMARSATPRLQPFAAAGFLFADGALVREVPFDPHLDFVFDGEEILYSARMWTHGWDMYSPTESILFHYYGRKAAKRIYAEKKVDWSNTMKISQKRVQHILGAKVPNSTIPLVPEAGGDPRIYRELDIYGLGKVRTMDEYYRFARLNPVNRTSDQSYCDLLQNKKK